MNIMPPDAGWIEVICGPMFSGKSEELIRRLRRVQIARQPLQVFKPGIDDRYHATRVVSHSSAQFDAVTVSTAAEVSARISSDVKVVGIDEVQFFDAAIVDLAGRLADSGVRVIAAGLDLDYTGEPFGPVPRLIAMAESVTKTLAICMRCGAPAGRTQRLSGGREQVKVGATDSYEARCRRCHVPRVEPLSGELFPDAVP